MPKAHTLRLDYIKIIQRSNYDWQIQIVGNRLLEQNSNNMNNIQHLSIRIEWKVNQCYLKLSYLARFY